MTAALTELGPELRDGFNRWLDEETEERMRHMDIHLDTENIDIYEAMTDVTIKDGAVKIKFDHGQLVRLLVDHYRGEDVYNRALAAGY